MIKRQDGAYIEYETLYKMYESSQKENKRLTNLALMAREVIFDQTCDRYNIILQLETLYKETLTQKATPFI